MAAPYPTVLDARLLRSQFLRAMAPFAMCFRCANSFHRGGLQTTSQCTVTVPLILQRQTSVRTLGQTQRTAKIVPRLATRNEIRNRLNAAGLSRAGSIAGTLAARTRERA